MYAAENLIGGDAFASNSCLEEFIVVVCCKDVCCL